jgi:DNA primase
MKKSRTLFGVTATENASQLVVVESPLDCLRVWTATGIDAVAICGSSMSDDQFKLVRSADRVVIAFDNDTAGQKASAEAVELCRKYGVNGQFFNYSQVSAKDPGDMDDDQIAWAIQNAQTYLLGPQAYVYRNPLPVPAEGPRNAAPRSVPSSVRDGGWEDPDDLSGD